MPKQTRPKCVKLASQRTTYATAYANHPPSKTKPHWSWKMFVPNPLSGGTIQMSLGRVPEDQVLTKMREYYTKQFCEVAIVDPRMKTIAELMNTWFGLDIKRRGPNSSLRPEYRLSKYTLRGYHSAVKAIIWAAGGAKVKDLSSKLVALIRMKLQEKYAPRTIHLCLSRLEQAVKWARKHGFNIPEVEFNNRRPGKGTGYVSNRYTPSDAEVMKVLEGCSDLYLKMAVFIGWKTGARTGEVTELVWGDISQDEEGCWILCTGKTGTRNVPIAKKDYEQLMIWKGKKQAQTRLFPKSFRTRLSVLLIEACHRMRVKPFVFYGLRRLRVDTLQRMGVESAVYERIMGHSMSVGKDAYRQPNRRDLQDALYLSIKP